MFEPPLSLNLPVGVYFLFSRSFYILGQVGQAFIITFNSFPLPRERKKTKSGLHEVGRSRVYLAIVVRIISCRTERIPRFESKRY